MPGDEWQRFANLRALLAWQWCHPGRPLLFMGGELAQLREWSHERELDWWLLSDRRHEGIRRLVTELNRLQAELPALWAGDDLPPDTFGWLDADDAAHSVFAFWRRAPGGGTGSAGDQGVRTPVVVVANLTPVPRPGYRLGAPEGGAWRLALDTDDPRWGGSGHLGAERGPVEVEAEAVPWQGQEASLGVALAPLAVMVWVPERALSA
jgi:1,4-alpha-glucan branching enzyme